jgi:hypothetical protein
MHKSATKCNETVGKWCINKHGASKIIDTLETYQGGGLTECGWRSGATRVARSVGSGNCSFGLLLLACRGGGPGLGATAVV